jgi:hypothetical protein
MVVIHDVFGKTKNASSGARGCQSTVYRVEECAEALGNSGRQPQGRE